MLELIDCTRQPGGLRITPSACAALWGKGATANPWEPAYHCRNCAIGAGHAGVEVTVRAPSSRRCCRCGSRGTRLIGRILCPSCFNRQREFVEWVNARGGTPVHFKPLGLWTVDDLVVIGRTPEEVLEVLRRVHGTEAEPNRLVARGSATREQVSAWWVTLAGRYRRGLPIARRPATANRLMEPFAAQAMV